MNILAILLLLSQLTLAGNRDGVLRVAVAGDTGEGAERAAAGIRAVQAEQPLDAIFLAGDTFYPCGVATPSDPQWSRVHPLTGLGVAIYPVLGNHDYCGKSDPDAQIRATGLVPNWNFPARDYLLRTGVADVLFLDTTPLAKGRPNDTAATIEKAFADSKAPWRVVVGHHPVLSSGYHGYFPRAEVRRMRTLIPALRDAHVDFWICGHDHHMEVLRGRMLHLVSGAGSEPVPPIKLRTSTIYPPEIGRERIGFAVVEIRAQSIRLRIYDERGKARTEWIERKKLR